MLSDVFFSGFELGAVEYGRHFVVKPEVHPYLPNLIRDTKVCFVVEQIVFGHCLHYLLLNLCPDPLI